MNTCTGGNCNVSQIPIPSSGGVHLSRDVSGTVSLTGNAISATGLPIGSTVIISGCTIADFDGTFTVSFSSLDNFNPVVQWAQAGPVEGQNDFSCQLTTPYHELTFFPGAFVLASDSTNGFEADANTVPWAVSDSIMDTPSYSLGLSDLLITRGQSSPTGGSQGISIVDEGPTPLPYLFSGANTGGFGGILAETAPGWGLINGNFYNDLHITHRPANNGAVLQIDPYESISSTLKPYYLWRDGNGNLGEVVDPLLGKIEFNRGYNNPIQAL
jgi:hypothetical protein